MSALCLQIKHTTSVCNTWATGILLDLDVFKRKFKLPVLAKLSTKRYMNSSVIHQSSIRWTQTKQKNRVGARSQQSAVCFQFSPLSSRVLSEVVKKRGGQPYPLEVWRVPSGCPRGSTRHRGASPGVPQRVCCARVRARLHGFCGVYRSIVHLLEGSSSAQMVRFLFFGVLKENNLHTTKKWKQQP